MLKWLDGQSSLMNISDEQIEEHFCLHRISYLHHTLCPLRFNDNIPVRRGKEEGIILFHTCVKRTFFVMVELFYEDKDLS